MFVKCMTINFEDKKIELHVEKETGLPQGTHYGPRPKNLPRLSDLSNILDFVSAQRESDAWAKGINDAATVKRDLAFSFTVGGALQFQYHETPRKAVVTYIFDLPRDVTVTKS